ncbi:MAG: peptidylprolyl isomerase [Acidobacteriota bacterium]
MSKNAGRSSFVLLVVSLLVATWLLLGGCASSTGGVEPGSTPSPASPAASPTDDSTALPSMELRNPEERALLLLLADRRMLESVTLQQAKEGDASLRRMLAETLGQVRDPRARLDLQELLFDDDVMVRRAAAFALGELGVAESRGPLLRAAAEADSETGILAVEALGKIGTPVLEVADALADLPDEESWGRLLPHLFRFDEEDTANVAAAAVTGTAGDLRRTAVYALARNPQPASLGLLRSLTGDEDPRARAWVARALGLIGDGSDLARLRPMLEGTADGPTIQALAAATRLAGSGEAAPPEDWLPHLRELVVDSRPQVRLAAISASYLWMFDDRLAAAVEGGLDEPLLRSSALVALARGGVEGAADRVRLEASQKDAVRRAAAARAAAFIGAPALVERLMSDPRGPVRVAAFETFLATAPEGEIVERVTEVLAQDTDAAMRVLAFDWAAAHPVVDIDVLGEAAVFAVADRNIESSLSAIRALAARAAGTPLDRGTVVALLEKMSQLDDFTTRRAAAATLLDLEREAPAIGSAEGLGDTVVYREVLQRTQRDRFAEIRTDAGNLTVRLECPRAPRTCLNFLSLAAQGFYDNLTFHRVVPDFVVQAGDPRGDGYGGPGFTLRDEINTLRYERGVLGMALAGADTGGSQWFITLSPQPHLDGGYTAFGQVAGGDEVLDRILPGTRIRSIVEVASP